MPTQIKTYQEMSALSAQMVDAARAQDWERLVALEKSIAALRDMLMSEEDGTDSTADERGAKAALIQRILDDDAEIRRYTEPWLEHVRQFLGGAAKRRRIENAYHAGVSPLGGSSAG